MTDQSKRTPREFFLAEENGTGRLIILDTESPMFSLLKENTKGIFVREVIPGPSFVEGINSFLQNQGEPTFSLDEVEDLTSDLIDTLEMYAMTNETFPEYGDSARRSIAQFQKLIDSRQTNKAEKGD